MEVLVVDLNKSTLLERMDEIREISIQIDVIRIHVCELMSTIPVIDDGISQSIDRQIHVTRQLLPVCVEIMMTSCDKLVTTTDLIDRLGRVETEASVRIFDTSIKQILLMNETVIKLQNVI